MFDADHGLKARRGWCRYRVGVPCPASRRGPTHAPGGRSPMRKILFIIGLLTALAVAPSAFAATASIPDPADDNGRSFSGPVTDLANLGVTWNGQALTVTA